MCVGAENKKWRRKHTRKEYFNRRSSYPPPSEAYLYSCNNIIRVKAANFMLLFPFFFCFVTHAYNRNKLFAQTNQTKNRFQPIDEIISFLLSFSFSPWCVCVRVCVCKRWCHSQKQAYNGTFSIHFYEKKKKTKIIRTKYQSSNIWVKQRSNRKWRSKHKEDTMKC